MKRFWIGLAVILALATSFASDSLTADERSAAYYLVLSATIVWVGIFYSFLFGALLGWLEQPTLSVLETRLGPPLTAAGNTVLFSLPIVAMIFAIRSDGFGLFYQGIFAVTLLSFLLVASVSLKPRFLVRRTSTALERLQNGQIALVLRPFGGVGYTKIPRYRSVIPRVYGHFLPTLWPSGTLERALEEESRRTLGVPTVALADRHLLVALRHPTYIRAADSEWQDVIRQLIGRSAIVYLILVPGRRGGESLVWELTEIMKQGLHGRFVIVLPPSRGLPRRTTNQLVDGLRIVFPGLPYVDERTVALLMRSDGQFRRFSLDVPAGTYPPTLNDYRSTLANIVRSASVEQPAKDHRGVGPTVTASTAEAMTRQLNSIGQRRRSLSRGLRAAALPLTLAFIVSIIVSSVYAADDPLKLISGG